MLISFKGALNSMEATVMQVQLC